MTSLLELPLSGPQNVDYLDGYHVALYEHGGRGIGYVKNPGAWGLGEYDWTLHVAIDADMRRLFITLEREVCTIAKYRPGTYDETWDVAIMRITTKHDASGVLLTDLDEALAPLLAAGARLSRSTTRREVYVDFVGNLQAWY